MFFSGGECSIWCSRESRRYGLILPTCAASRKFASGSVGRLRP